MRRGRHPPGVGAWPGGRAAPPGNSTGNHVADITMTDTFRDGCRKFGITDDMLRWSLERSGVRPKQLLTIDTTTSSRNYRVHYVNQADEKKWVHLFIVPPAAQEAFH